MRELPPIPPQTPQIPQYQVVAGPPKKTSPLLEVLTKVKERFSTIFGRLTYISPTLKKIL